jgi:hypothetical protein
MDKEINLFRHLVIEVFDRHRGAYADPPQSVQSILDVISNKYMRFANSAALENVLPSDAHPTSDFKTAMQFLYLRPITDGVPTVPVLSLKANFACSFPEVRARLALFFLDDEQEIRSQGYRYEAPEGPGNGKHDYYHVQPIRVIYRDKPGFQLPTAPWFLDSHPAWPVDAKDPVTLVLSLLISLYGLEFRKELLGYRVAPMLKNHIGRTHCLTIPAPSFWRVQCSGRNFHYATRYKQRDFEQFCDTTHRPRHTKSVISETDYYALPEGDQLLS